MKLCKKTTYHLGVDVDQLRHLRRIDRQFGHLGRRRRRRVKRPSVRIRLSFTIANSFFYSFIRVRETVDSISYLPVEWRRFGIGRRPSPV